VCSSGGRECPICLDEMDEGVQCPSCSKLFHLGCVQVMVPRAYFLSIKCIYIGLFGYTTVHTSKPVSLPP
jgi:hypothetical protein